MTQKPTMKIAETDVETTLHVAECEAVEDVIDRFGDLVDKAIEDYDLSTTMSAMVLFTIGLCEQIDDDHPAEQPTLDLFIERLRAESAWLTAQEVAAATFGGGGHA